MRFSFGFVIRNGGWCHKWALNLYNINKELFAYA